MDPAPDQARLVRSAAVTAVELALAAAIAYFAVFGVAFVIHPGLVERFGLRWTEAAGRAEVRCYYGAVSVALAGFLAYLWSEDLALQALTGVVFLAVAVLSVRLATTARDGSWKDEYPRMAVPIEAAFVAGLLLVRLTA